MATLPPLPSDDELIVLLKNRVSERRFAHSMGVAHTAYEVALAYGVDPKDAYTAGILHDWDKCYNDEEIRARVQELGLDINPVVLEGMCQTLHGITAAAYFEQNFAIDPSVAQAIRVHTTGSTTMSDLDMVVYIADCIEPGRKMLRVAELRKMVGKKCLEDLFLEIYGYWISLIIERNKTMHPDTVVVWNAYARRFAQRYNLHFDKHAKEL